jgi:hypothetical protein
VAFKAMGFSITVNLDDGRERNFGDFVSSSSTLMSAVSGDLRRERKQPTHNLSRLLQNVVHSSAH